MTKKHKATRNYVDIPSSSWTRGFLAQFKVFYPEESEDFTDGSSLPVKGFQQIKRGVIAYSIDISPFGKKWAEELPEVFSFFSLTQHYDKINAESYQRLSKIIFKKQMTKDLFLFCYPLKIFFAQRSRKKDRLENLSRNFFADNFSLPQGKVEIHSNRAFISSLFQKTQSLIKGNFSFLDINYFDGKITSTSILFVKERLQPYWVRDYWLLDNQGQLRKNKEGTDKEQPSDNEFYLWQWNNRELVFLSFSDLLEYEKELEDSANIEQIMMETEGRKNVDYGSVLARKKYRGEAVYPILCQENDKIVPVGYVQVLCKEPLDRNKLEIIENQLDWLSTAIISGVHTKINVKCDIIDFNSQGLRLRVVDKELIMQLQKVSLFKVKLHFISTNEEFKVETTVKIIFRKTLPDHTMMIGLQYRSFSPFISPNGEPMEGKVNYLNLLKSYRSYYGIKTVKGGLAI